MIIAKTIVIIFKVLISIIIGYQIIDYFHPRFMGTIKDIGIISIIIAFIGIWGMEVISFIEKYL